MDETRPAAQPELYDPQDAVFPLELLSDGEVREFSRVLMSSYFAAGLDTGPKEDARNALMEKLYASLYAFCQAQPERAAGLLQVIINDPDFEPRDMDVAAQLGAGLMDVDPERGFAGLLTIAFDGEHYLRGRPDTDEYNEGAIDAQGILDDLRRDGRLTEDQVRRLAEREESWR